jgi:glucoamylase
MALGRAALMLAVAVVVTVPLVSGGPTDELFRLHSDPDWLAQARPLGPGAPPWARRMYRRSLLVLRAMTNPQTGAVVAGRRDGWEYVWPRDASGVAMALASAGYRGEARLVVRFLLGLDLDAAARFYEDGMPVEGRAAQGDGVGWVDAAAQAAGLGARVDPQPWRDRADYQEGEAGDYLGNAIASAGEPKGIPAGAPSVRRPAEEEIRKSFGANEVLMRKADDSESGIDTAAAWAVRPFRAQALYPLARRTLLRIAAESGRYGIVPSEDWSGGNDPWTAPTAWTAWSLAALGERRAALHLMTELRRDSTPSGLLPERVDAHTGIPTSTTPLAWSHAFAILAIRQLWR